MSHPQDARRPHTQISVFALAECPFSMSADYATEYLRRAEAGGPEGTIRVPWPAPFGWLRRRVSLSFGIHEDILEAGRPHDELRFHWSSGSLLLPNFRGTMRFRIESLRTGVYVDGGYTPPLGAIGHLFDQTIGKRLARASLQELADRIAAYLSDSESNWHVAHAAIAVPV